MVNCRPFSCRGATRKAFLHYSSSISSLEVYFLRSISFFQFFQALFSSFLRTYTWKRRIVHFYGAFSLRLLVRDASRQIAKVVWQILIETGIENSWKRSLQVAIIGCSYLAEYLLSKNYIVHGVKRRASLFNTNRIDHLMTSDFSTSSFEEKLSNRY